MMDWAGRAFDRAEWHEEAASAAGQPRAGAFAHAELYLAWLERRDLLVGTPVAVDALPADAMTDEGRAFTEAYYGRYLDDYGLVFADEGLYGVLPDEDAFDRIARVIDQRYAEWVYADRPELPPEDEPREQLASLLEGADLPPDLTAAAVIEMSPEQLVETLQQLIDRGRSQG